MCKKGKGNEKKLEKKGCILGRSLCDTLRIKRNGITERLKFCDLARIGFVLLEQRINRYSKVIRNQFKPIYSRIIVLPLGNNAIAKPNGFFEFGETHIVFITQPLDVSNVQFFASNLFPLDEC